MTEPNSDLVTKTISNLVVKSISGDPDDKIFNFNLHECFNLHQHLTYIDRLTKDVHLVLDEMNGTLAWGTNVPRKETGIILRMETIPSLIYHLFIKGKTIYGTQVMMRIRNHLPEIYLSPELVWKIGAEETKTVCFRALSHQTDLIMFTDTDCALPLVPFAYTMTMLNIIPDCIICKGFIEGPTGPGGNQGPVGLTGPDGFIGATGVEGPTGPDGVDGPVGSAGPQGSTGPIGPIGAFGPFGEPGSDLGPTGAQGRTGPFGFMGAIGSMGTSGDAGLVGPPGAAGFSGTAGFPGNQGSTGAQGPVGIIGPQGAFGVDPVNGSYISSWNRGGPALAITTITYQIIGNQVTLTVPEFTAGATLLNSPINGSSNLPAEIQTGGSDFVFFPMLVLIDGSPTMVSFRVGPIQLIIFGALDAGGLFANTVNVDIPTQSFTYYIV